MPTRSLPAIALALFAWPAAVALAMAVGACTTTDGTGTGRDKGSTVTHLCKPQESVRFSCELQDHRLLSLCASPDMAAFKGPKKDNPGYAYLAVGAPGGGGLHSYPPNPYDYKQYFYKGVSAHVIPYLFVTSEKGEFFFFSEADTDDAQGAGQWTPENLPDGWSISENDKTRACTRLLEYDPYPASGFTNDYVWRDKERARRETEKAKVKAKQP